MIKSDKDTEKMKRIIGIAPAPIMGAPEDPTGNDKYNLGCNYVNRTTEAGCVPICLAPTDYRLSEEALDLCDGFLVQGGSEFYLYHFQIIHHAITRGKKYLGICLGQQLIYVYFELRRRVEELGYEGDLVEAIYGYMTAQEKGFTVQKRIPDHRKTPPKRGCEDEAKHDVDIFPGTILHRLLGRDKMRICSFHKLCTPPTQELVRINAWSALGDGVVEGTEYGDNILGVQGHPEYDNLLPEIFSFLSED